MVDKAFDLFVQGPQGLARKTGGMGIGLALVKRLAELQGGSVSVSSAEGAGAVFTVSFPALSAPRDEAPMTQDTRPKPRRILLIEDNDDLRQTVAASLTLRGHEVYEAPDGETGLRLADHKKPEIAIIDIGLPDIDGYEVARQLRANRSTLQIGLVALTGYGQQEDKRKAAEAGFHKHLTKPVDFEALDDALAASLSGQNA
jgi:CheY-like chemotaxis protein